jgi:hypothetical protein
MSEKSVPEVGLRTLARLPLVGGRVERIVDGAQLVDLGPILQNSISAKNSWIL